MLARACILVAALTATPAVASPDEPERDPPTLPAARGTQLLKADAPWRWQIVTAPRVLSSSGMREDSPKLIAVGAGYLLAWVQSEGSPATTSG